VGSNFFFGKYVSFFFHFGLGCVEYKQNECGINGQEA